MYEVEMVGCERTGLSWQTTGVRFAPDGRVGTLNKVDGTVTLRPDAPKMLLILPRAALDATIAALLQDDARWPVRAQ